jgi:hypothetical protein
MSLGDSALHQLLASIGADIAVISAKHEGGRQDRAISTSRRRRLDVDAEDEAGEGESLQTGAGKVGGAPVLDAFSPFYQIDLPPLTDAGKARRRAQAARGGP